MPKNNWNEVLPDLSDHSVPDWVKTPDIGADLSKTPVQREIEGCSRPLGGCLVTIFGTGAFIGGLYALSQNPNVIQFVEAHLGK